ncbi:hypothetical protein NI531_07825 [Proteus penneri]|uniref:hypothetical protein n=1 Tax=Proteus penneri TaxID=102862 RepID=UPI002096B9BF|nr:hypothetical protein [Proteus penneri]MCO8050636.1 hypothetical protein [Proteus penneri]
MKSISNIFAIKRQNAENVFNNDNLKGYVKLLNNIKDIKNTPLIDIPSGCNGKKVSVNITEISRALLSKILKTYTPTEISSYRVSKENKEKSIKLLNKAYEKIDKDISGWWKDEKKILPSSIINRTIDNLYKKDKVIINKETKQILFFLISKKFNLNLDENVAQSTMIQHLQNIPEVVKAIDDLGLSENSYLKYETYCLIAEYIYNFLSENKVDFSKIKEAVKEIAERKLVTPKNKLTQSSPYSKHTLAFL